MPAQPHVARLRIGGLVLSLIASIAASSPASGAAGDTLSPQTAATLMATVAGDSVDILVAAKTAHTPVVNNDATAQQVARTLPFLASTTCVRCDTGLPLAALTNWSLTQSPAAKALAISSLNTIIAAERQPNGALGHNPGPDIDTMFSANNVGFAALLLARGGDETQAREYTATVVRAADFLVTNNNLAWFTNGNVVIGNAVTMALAYRLSGDPKYLTYYHTALTFAVTPNQARWPGRGFTTTKYGSAVDGSDSAGYFTETGTTTGFDPDYTQLQSEQLSRLYLVTGDPTVLRLLNMVTNQLLPRVDRSTWLMDASGGSRHDYTGLMPFDTSAISVLAFLGQRTDLVPEVASQVRSIDAKFRRDIPRYPVADGDYYALGETPASIVMAAYAADALPDDVTRISGADRIATAVAVSQDRFSTGAPSAVLANAYTFPDALAGSALAKQAESPLLLTGSASLDPRVAAQLQATVRPGGVVHLLGGTASLGTAVEDAVARLGFVPDRISGTDRYQTATAVAARLTPSASTSTCRFLLANGVVFADGASASGVASPDEPLLFTDAASVPAATLAAISACASPASGPAHLVALTAVGGAAVSAARAAAALLPPDTTVVPIDGTDRYETSALLFAHDQGGDSPATAVTLTSGLDYPDALVGGTYGAPVLLTDTQQLSAATQRALAGAPTVRHVTVVGGTGAVSTTAASTAGAALQR